MKLIVVDTETTGIGDTDQVLEVAIINAATGDLFTSLVKPTCPITPGARAAHHITDRELAKAPSMAKLLASHSKMFAGDVFVAHNANFDLMMLLQSGVPKEALPKATICTWRCACHLYPDVSAYSNQVLRYELDLEVELPVDLPPHRALPDAVVTTALLNRMLETHTAKELVKLTAMPVLQSVVRFGQHRGKRWEEIDEGYLKWILRQQFDDDVRFTAKHWLDKRIA